MSTSSEFRHFAYAAKLKNASEIVLCTKVFNRDARKDNLSVVYSSKDHQVFAYGSNDSGCLGLASLRMLYKVPAPIKELSGKPLAKLASGNRFVIALTEAGQLYSWGDNKFGQLGLGKSVASVNKPTLIESVKGEHILDVSCGQFHVLLLTTGRQLYAFGSNVSGAIGNGTTFHQSKPVHLTSLADAGCQYLGVDIAAISAGGWHSACLNLKGELLVWGWNEQGQCGQGEVAKSKQVHPQRVLLPTLDPAFPCVNAVIKSVHCGLHHTLALTFEGLVFAFGSNEYGECAQDVTSVKACPKAVPVNLEDIILEICALSKSRLSMARSQLHFFVWGQSATQPINASANAVNTVSQPNIPRKFTISQQVQSSLSFNMMLANNEAHQFSLEVNTNELPFSSSAIVIADRSIRPSNGKLNFTFNSPTDSDVVFVLGNSSSTMSIFAQKTVVETYDSFLKELFHKFGIGKNQEENKQKFEQISMTIARKQQKFSQIAIENISYETLYAYLFFIYSNYLVIMPNQLIKTMQLCETLNNELLLNLCLQFIEKDFTPLQLCNFYKCALNENLSKVYNFCVDRAQEMLKDKETAAQLYYSRQSADLSLTCIDSQGRQHNILAHRLVFKVKSQLYQVLANSVIQSNFASQLTQLNSITSEKELLLSNTIHFGTFFTPFSLDLFVRYVYCQDVSSESELTISVLIELIKASKLIQEADLEAFCIEQMKKSITIENVCNLYVTYSQDPDNVFLVDMFIKVIKENWDAFVVSNEFRKLLINQDSITFSLLLNLSNFSLKM